MDHINIVAQILINGILFGTMYGIAASGLSLIFGTMRIIFLAQGTIIIFLAYICYWLFTLLGIDPYLSLIIIIPLSLLLGTAFYQGLFKEAAALEDKNISLLIAIGLMFFVENLMTVMAASEDRVAATLMGIGPHRVNAVAFAIGIGLAGIAGISLATIYPFDPFYGFIFVLKALISFALGGIGNVLGALLGGIILGLLESLASFFLDVSSSYCGYFLFLSFCYTVIAQGWNFVAGYTGQISMGQHAFFGLGAYTRSEERR